MDTALAKLIADLESAAFQHGCAQGFWELVERKEATLYVRLFAPDDRAYVMELACSDYGNEPIGGRFVDAGRNCVNGAWPKGDGTFNGWVKFADANPFICWDQDRYGLQHHQEWRPRRAWTKKPNQLVAYLDFMRQLLNVQANGYERQSLALTS